MLEAGSLVLGFKVDPYETLKKIIKEIQSLHQVYSSSPIFGVEFSTADEWEGPATPTSDAIQEDVELVTTKKDTLAVSLFLATMWSINSTYDVAGVFGGPSQGSGQGASV